MGISYSIISDHIRSYQIISQLRFNMFKLALLVVAFAAVHLTQGGRVWKGRCMGSLSTERAGDKTKVMCDGKKVGQVSCNPPTDMGMDNGKNIISCDPLPPLFTMAPMNMNFPPMQWAKWG